MPQSGYATADRSALSCAVAGCSHRGSTCVHTCSDVAGVAIDTARACLEPRPIPGWGGHQHPWPSGPGGAGASSPHTCPAAYSNPAHFARWALQPTLHESHGGSVPSPHASAMRHLLVRSDAVSHAMRQVVMPVPASSLRLLHAPNIAARVRYATGAPHSLYPPSAQSSICASPQLVTVRTGRKLPQRILRRRLDLRRAPRHTAYRPLTVLRYTPPH